MKEHKKTTKIFWIAAISAMTVLFVIMTSALVFTGRVNNRNRLELNKLSQQQTYRIAESQNDIKNLSNESDFSMDEPQELILAG